MKKIIPLVAIAMSLTWLVLVGNLMIASALPMPDTGTITPFMENDSSLHPKSIVIPSVSIKLPQQAHKPATDGRLIEWNGESPMLMNTPSPPEPASIGSQLVEPKNTPALPGGASPNFHSIPLAVTAGGLEQEELNLPVIEQSVESEPHIKQNPPRHAQFLHKANRRFQVTLPDKVTEDVAPRQDEICEEMILNSQMDVVEFGDGTGSVEYWSILFQQIYFDSREEYYYSPAYSLVMVDETDGSDQDLWDEDTDYDEFGQGFQAPSNLTYVKVSYSRLYANANSDDIAWSNLWTLDNDGYLDELIAYATIGDMPEGWSSRYWELTSDEDSELLAALSGKPVALTFDMSSNMTDPSQVIWLDDAQVRLCYKRGSHAIYLPITFKQYGTGSPGPICKPREPDSTAQQGSTVVGAVCSGSFDAMDEKDYYSLNLDGVTKVRLRLFNLPSGSNWDAMIYEDIEGYPLACHIETIGDNDKYKDCAPLNPSKDYLVLVSRGPVKSSGSYQMSVEQR
jgi:hypothetical protein